MTGLERLNAFANDYRRRGWNPLPSRPNDGRPYPPFRYGPARDHGLSECSFLEIARKFDCHCLQVATGGRWGLAVLDLDGPLAVEVWTLWSMHRINPPTWAVRHDPEGGMHLWYAVPRGTTLDHRSVLWSMPESSHTMIELIGDGGLIVAPPSVSTRTGNEYAFLPGRGPDTIPEPAQLPAWVLDLAARSDAPRRESLTPRHVAGPERVLTGCPPRGRGASDEADGTSDPRRGVVTPPHVAGEERVLPLTPLRSRGSSHLDRDAVLSSLDESAALGIARDMGLRIVGSRPNEAGWVRARSLFRDDRNPSAMYSVETCRWWEPEFGHKPISIFDLAVLLGHASDYSDAVDFVGGRIGLTA